jgi:hypothetical protein
LPKKSVEISMANSNRNRNMNVNSKQFGYIPDTNNDTDIDVGAVTDWT